MNGVKKKLIEVSLPLEAINRESAREKSIRHGHPSTLHLWWARRPLAACRAVLFSQLVDDPSAHPDHFPTEESQAAERQRLFDIIERLVVWENINDEALLKEAQAEILKSTDGNPPAILDPFAGGGSIPLEAQRLGLEAHASDLNPVAVLINKALIEIPPKWAGKPPVFPGAAEGRLDWPKATGLAEDVRRYGQWMRDEAEKRIGHLYPQVTLDDGTKANVIAWIWARTVRCANPACGVDVPTMSSFWLSRRKHRATWVDPKVVDGQVRFEIRTGSGSPSVPTKQGRGAQFRCIACGTITTDAYVKEEGRAGRLGTQLVATVAQGDRHRIYLAADDVQRSAAEVARVEGPDGEMPDNARWFSPPTFGITAFADVFTDRQLAALTTFSDLVGEARERILLDALSAGLSDEPRGLEDGGTGAAAYADSVAVYLGLTIGRQADRSSSLNGWDNSRDTIRNVFARQALPMVWDFAESNPLGSASGSYVSVSLGVPESIDASPAGYAGFVEQADAAARTYAHVLVATDPPYYDNIGYANLSDFFYGWLRRSLAQVVPDLFVTLQTPKADELVADSYRHGGKKEASDFFEHGFDNVFARIRESTPQDLPVTVFYAFKQSETNDDGTANTGWQTLLEGMIGNGWEVSATWPMRTELANKVSGQGANMLASSVVLALRPRPKAAATTSRRSFVQELRTELPRALRDLQQGSIAPVDMAQAAIGPGMAIFSRYSRVLESDGSDMTVRTALALINHGLDEVLVEQEGDFDAETRFAIKWFSQFGWNEASSGEADVLTRAVNSTVAELERGGIFRATAGKARLLEPSDMSEDWDPALDKDISVWEVAVRTAYGLQTEGVERASEWMAAASSRVDMDAVKELSYLLYSICEKKGWTDSALLFNGLGTSWSDLAAAAKAPRSQSPQQATLDLDTEADEE